MRKVFRRNQKPKFEIKTPVTSVRSDDNRNTQWPT